MSVTTSDQDIGEHVHIFRHLIATCTPYGGVGYPWIRKDEFYCVKCLHIEVQTRQDESHRMPEWWIDKEEIM